MRTTVVTGMLGAGKTTFISNMLNGATEKTVVLVNDFGKAGIDGEIMRSGGIESIELPSGCVCCTLRFDLITTIQQSRDRFSPEHLVVEPSGIASTSGVLEVLASLRIEPVSVICVIDPHEFTDVYETQMYGSFFKDQVLNADIILVNKTDIAGEVEIARAEQIAEEMNPAAIMLRTVNAKPDMSLPFVVSDHTNPVSGNVHIHLKSSSTALESGVAFAKVEDLFHALSDGGYGNVVRAKALVQTDKGPYRFDLSAGRVDIVLFEKEINESRVVVIGNDLKEIRSRIS